jgi:cellulose synthase operon protein C
MGFVGCTFSGGVPAWRSWSAPRLALLLALLAGAAHAQAAGEEAPAESAREPASLLARVGLERLVSALAGPASEQRVHAIRRLGRIGTPRALDALVGFALKPESALSTRDRLALVRALAPHQGQRGARQLLAGFLVQPSGDKNQAVSPMLLELVQDGAALALARDGRDAALAVLGQALRTQGSAAAAAARALEAHPPPRLEPLLDAPGEPTPELARLLGRLGDQRAFERLRDFVRGESAAVRAAAALALTELGDLETEALAERWLAQDVPELREGALDILSLAHHPRAAKVLEAELGRAALTPALKRRLLSFPAASLQRATLARIDAGDAGGAPWLWTLLGRIGGDRARERLSQALANGEGARAAHGIVQLPSADASQLLEQLLERRVALPWCARIASARAFARGETYAGLPALLAKLAAAGEPTASAAASWGLALSDTEATLAALRSADEARLLAAASNVLVFGSKLVRDASALLAEARPGRQQAALGALLVHEGARALVPSRTLLRFLDEESLLAPLALRALAARAEPELAPLVDRYLQGPDALLRAHVARGLGESTEPGNSVRLIERYELEEDPEVRRALVMALSLRRGQLVTRTLQLAADLDPDQELRAAARLALKGVELRDPAPGREVAWAELVPTAPGSQGGGALLVLAPGLAFPAFAAPDGLLAVAGVSARPIDLRFR